MATDIRAIKALNDFPETPYEPTASQNVLEFRWIHGQCFQFRLPDGKVLMTDPFLPQNPKAWRRENTPVLDLNELGPVDYVTINHAFTIRKNLRLLDIIFAILVAEHLR